MENKKIVTAALCLGGIVGLGTLGIWLFKAQKHPGKPLRRKCGAYASSLEHKEELSGSGYERELFIDQVTAEDYICPICQDIVRDCVKTSCGHIYCEQCLNKQLKIKRECPVDKRKLKGPDVHIPTELRLMIPTKLMVSCTPLSSKERQQILNQEKKNN